MSDDRSAREILTKTYKTKKMKKNDWLRILKTIVLVGFILAVVGAVGVTGYVLTLMKDMPEIDETLLKNYAISSEIYDKDNVLVASLHGVENRMPVTLEEINPVMIKALLSVEDKRFYRHPGIDPYRIMGAVVANLKDGFGAQGGSTLTQQLVKISFFDPKDISIKRKVQEAFVSLKVERAYTKDEILEIYLNKVYFGRGAYGVEAAAKTFFNTSAKDLTPAQSALLTGVIQNPWANSPINHPVNAGRRYRTVLMLMENNNVISKAEREAIVREYEEKGFGLDLSFTAVKEDRKYQSFIDNAFEEALNALNLRDQAALIYSGGYKIYTTMDTKIQNKMEEVYNDNTKFPRGRGDKIIQSAMVVIDPKTGEIRGLIGGRNLETSRGFNRATQAIRQPGSAFKPIAVFGPALEMGYSPASVFDDYPKAYPNINEETIVFRNIDSRHRGIVSMRRVLTESINIASVKAIEEIGIDNGFMFAQDLGISTLVASGQVNDKGYSLALGGLTYGVSPLELTSAYSAFANGGQKAATHSIRKIEDYYGNVLYEYQPSISQVMSPETAYLMTSMLQSAVADGTGVRANFGNWPIAGKTGTTSFNADIWFVGYTPELIGGIWMGYDKEETMSNVYGGTHAAPVWREIMEVAHQGLTPTEFPVPEGIVSVTIDTKSGLLPNAYTPAEYQRTELFNKEFAPTEVSKAWISLPGYYPGVFMVRQEPWQLSGFDAVPEDANLEPPAHLNPYLNGWTPSANGNTGGESISFQISGQDTLGGLKLYWNWLGSRDGIRFEIHKSTSQGFTPTPSTRIASVETLEFTDERVNAGESYYYTVIAVNTTSNQRAGISNTLRYPLSSGNNGSSGSTGGNTGNVANTGPVSAPRLTITASKQGEQFVINLKWTPPDTPGTFEYLIYRDSEPGFTISAEKQLQTSVSALQFSDNTVQRGNNYFYKVVARRTNSPETSPASNEIRVGIPAAGQ